MKTGPWFRRSTGLIGGLTAVALLGLAAPGGSASAGSQAPGGHFDRLVGAGDGVSWSVTGWAVDQDTPGAPVSVAITVDGAAAKTAVANGDRPDVAGKYAAAGAAHGFAVTLPLPAAGSHTVCVYATDTDGSGASTLLGCKVGQSAGIPVPTTPTTTAPTTTPTTPTTVAPAAPARLPGGRFDTLTGSSAAKTWTVTGWAVDLDTPASAVKVSIYVDGTLVTAVTADGARADVAAKLPTAGAAHGFAVTMPKPAAGGHLVCVSALNTDGSGTSSLLGCRLGTS
jgi:hypothetical protein